MSVSELRAFFDFFIGLLKLDITPPTDNLKYCLTPELLQVRMNISICGALRDLVPFVQFKKRKKHPWRSVTFSKVAG